MYINMVPNMDLTPYLAERGLSYDDVDCVIIDEVHKDGMLDLVVVLNRVVEVRIEPVREGNLTIFFKRWCQTYV